MTHPALEEDGLHHLATEAEWAGYQRTGLIEPASLASEGFIHCSFGRQVPGTVERHFAGVTDLVALVLDVPACEAIGMIIEDSYGSGDAFPHVYGPVPVSAVTQVLVLLGPPAGSA